MIVFKCFQDSYSQQQRFKVVSRIARPISREVTSGEFIRQLAQTVITLGNIVRICVPLAICETNFRGRRCNADIRLQSIRRGV